MTEKILALDISSKTGWSLLSSDGKDCTLLDYGKLSKFKEPDIAYPNSYIIWAEQIFSEINTLWLRNTPDVMIIEETSGGSKSAYSQKILEWVHFLVAKNLVMGHTKAVYLLTEQWRRETGCLMSKEESKHNKEVKKFKEKNETSIAYDINGKRIGKITRKHVNVRRANEVFSKFLKEPLRKKDEDTADSLLLGYCYHLRKAKNETVRSESLEP
jgi:hypothetical protein